MDLNDTNLIVRQFQPENMDVDNQNSMQNEEDKGETPFRAEADINEANLESKIVDEDQINEKMDEAGDPISK